LYATTKNCLLFSFEYKFKVFGILNQKNLYERTFES